MASKKYATVNKKRCVSCGACTKVCPKGAVTVWKGCYAVVDPVKCVGCGLCKNACPADCIILEARLA